MKPKIRIILLGIYDLVLAFGAIYTGVLMLTDKKVFHEFPKEWLYKVPWDSWIIPGIIAIVLFGVGNIIAFVLCFKKSNNNSWFMSAIMGCILLVSIILQVIFLGEWYLATVELLICSIVQLLLSIYGFIGAKRYHCL